MKALLTDTMERALSFLDELPHRKVGSDADLDTLREAMGGPDARHDRARSPSYMIPLRCP